MSPDEPFGQASDPDEELGVLCRALEMRQGFSLYFVLCNDARERDRRISQLRERFSGESFQEVAVQPEEENLLWHLRESSTEKPPRAVFVHSLENWLAADRDGDSVAFLRSLNVTRNTFPLEFPMPFIFWVPVFLLRLFSQGCPDFLSVRSGLYNLNSDAPTPMEREAIQQFDNLTTAYSLPYDERENRVPELENNLKEYLRLPDIQKNPLTEIRYSHELATLYYSLARYSESILMLRQALKISETSFGENHPETSTRLNNLAELLRTTGQYEEAEFLLRRALAISEITIGKDHPDTGTRLNNLAILLQTTGHNDEAERLFRKALAIAEEYLGENHTATGVRLNNLADLLRITGRYDEAELLVKRALKIAEANLGENHPTISLRLNLLAMLYQKKEMYDEAEILYQRALKILETSLGAYHPETASCLNNLGMLFQILGRYDEAEPLYRRALYIMETNFGDKHWHTGTCLNNLASLLYKMRRMEEAEVLFQKAMKSFEDSLSIKHTRTQVAANNWLFCLQEMEARRLFPYSEDKMQEIERVRKLIQPLANDGSLV